MPWTSTTKPFLAILRRGVIRRLSSDGPAKTRTLLQALKSVLQDGAKDNPTRNRPRTLRDRDKDFSRAPAGGVSTIETFLQSITIHQSSMLSRGNENDAAAKSPSPQRRQDLTQPQQELTNKHFEIKNKDPSGVPSDGRSAIDAFLSSTASHQSSNLTKTSENIDMAKWRSLDIAQELEPHDKQKSIFDVFVVPKAPQAESTVDPAASSAFKDVLVAFFQGETLSRQIDSKYPMSNKSKEEVRRWIRELRSSKVQVRLPVLTKKCEEGISDNDPVAIKEQILLELKLQASEFRKQLDWDQEQYKYAMAILHELAQLSFQNHKTLAVLIIWDKMKEAGEVRQDTINALLLASSSLAGGLLTKNRSNSLESTVCQALNPREMAAKNSDPTFPENLASIHDLLYEPNQQSISIRMRRFLYIGDAIGALGLVESGLVRIACISVVISCGSARDA
jgi:hypothetical protein